MISYKSSLHNHTPRSWDKDLEIFLGSSPHSASEPKTDIYAYLRPR